MGMDELLPTLEYSIIWKNGITINLFRIIDGMLLLWQMQMSV